MVDRPPPRPGRRLARHRSPPSTSPTPPERAPPPPWPPRAACGRRRVRASTSGTTRQSLAAAPPAQRSPPGSGFRREPHRSEASRVPPAPRTPGAPPSVCFSRQRLFCLTARSSSPLSAMSHRNRRHPIMITKLGSLFAGHVDLDDEGLEGTAASRASSAAARHRAEPTRRSCTRSASPGDGGCRGRRCTRGRRRAARRVMPAA